MTLHLRRATPAACALTTGRRPGVGLVARPRRAAAAGRGPLKGLLLVAAGFLAGCGPQDTPSRVLLEEQYGPVPTGQTPTTYTQTTAVRVADKTVPLRFTWAAVRQAPDPAGGDSCWHIVRLHVERTGGEASVRFTAARSASEGCAFGDLLRPDGNAQPRAERRAVLLSYETRSGLKSYTVNGASVDLNGKGQLKPSSVLLGQ